jgi:outer membrane lipoprotein SlyB
MTKLLRRRSNIAGTAICATLALAFVAASATPTQAQMGPSESEGTAAGAIFGGIIGGVLGGRGAGAVGGAIAGAAIGSFIGNRIGAALDAEDRAALERTTRSAVTTGKSRRYTNKRTGVKARAQVVSSRRVDGRECRTIKQEVVLKDGTVLSDTIRACKGPNGWQA